MDPCSPVADVSACWHSQLMGSCWSTNGKYITIRQCSVYTHVAMIRSGLYDLHRSKKDVTCDHLSWVLTVLDKMLTASCRKANAEQLQIEIPLLIWHHF